MMGSVCSKHHPTSAWPASWYATILRSSHDITWFFFSIPIHHMIHKLWCHMTYRLLFSLQHTQSRLPSLHSSCSVLRGVQPRSLCWQCQHLCVVCVCGVCGWCVGGWCVCVVCGVCVWCGVRVETTQCLYMGILRSVQFWPMSSMWWFLLTIYRF